MLKKSLCSAQLVALVKNNLITRFHKYIDIKYNLASKHQLCPLRNKFLMNVHRSEEILWIFSWIEGTLFTEKNYYLLTMIRYSPFSKLKEIAGKYTWNCDFFCIKRFFRFLKILAFLNFACNSKKVAYKNFKKSCFHFTSDTEWQGNSNSIGGDQGFHCSICRGISYTQQFTTIRLYLFKNTWSPFSRVLFNSRYFLFFLPFKELERKTLSLPEGTVSRLVLDPRKYGRYEPRLLAVFEGQRSDHFVLRW